jgi:hypothetical protein
MKVTGQALSKYMKCLVQVSVCLTVEMLYGYQLIVVNRPLAGDKMLYNYGLDIFLEIQAYLMLTDSLLISG